MIARDREVTRYLRATVYSISSAISANRLYRDGSNDLNKDRVRHRPGLIHSTAPHKMMPLHLPILLSDPLRFS